MKPNQSSMNSGIYEPGRFYQIEYGKLRNLINYRSSLKEIQLPLLRATHDGKECSITMSQVNFIATTTNPLDKYELSDKDLVEVLAKGVKDSRVVLELKLFAFDELSIHSPIYYYNNSISLSATRLPDIEVDKKFFIENFEIIK